MYILPSAKPCQYLRELWYYFLKANASRKVSVLTGIVWQTKPTNNVVTTVWNQLVLFPIPLDVSVIPHVFHVANVTKDSSVINMATALLLDSAPACTVLIMKSIPTTIILAMKTVVLQHLVVLHQLLFNLDACVKKDSFETELAVSCSQLVIIDLSWWSQLAFVFFQLKWTFLGKCVEYANCGCPNANEEFLSCGNQCKEPTCDDDKSTATCPTVCERRCQCKTGYVRATNGQCVRKVSFWSFLPKVLARIKFCLAQNFNETYEKTRVLSIWNRMCWKRILERLW